MTSGVRPEPGEPGPGEPMPGVPVVPGPEASGAGRRRAADLAMGPGVYLVLLLFGMAQGVLGSFFYSIGPVPLAAVCFALLIFATCVLGGWGTGRPMGSLAPAAGWLISTFVIASGTAAGSVVVTAGAAGEWFLFGGSAAAAAGAVTSFVAWSRVSARAAIERQGREIGR